MSFGKSKSSTSTSTSTTNLSRNLNIQDVEGTTIAEAGDVSIVSSDQGAFDAAESIARESIAAGEEIGRTSAAVLRDVAESSFDFGARAFDVAEQTTSRALGEGFDFGRSSLDLVSEAGGRQASTFSDALAFGDAVSRREREVLSESLSFGETALEGQTDFARDLFGRSLEAVGSVVEQGQTQLGNTVTALNAIAREQSKSTDERVADIASNAIRYGLIGLAVVVVALLALRFAR